MRAGSPVVEPGAGIPVEFSPITIEWEMSKEMDHDAEQTFSTVFINESGENSRHYRPNCDKFLNVLSGSCSLGDEVFHMRQKEPTRILAGVVHNPVNDSSDPLRAIISFPDGDRARAFLWSRLNEH
jgi:mannose-6-phosphate isomerase-like protein (cupin superfamily)